MITQFYSYETIKFFEKCDIIGYGENIRTGAKTIMERDCVGEWFKTPINLIHTKRLMQASKRYIRQKGELI